MEQLFTSEIFYEYLRNYCKQKEIALPSKESIKKIIQLKKVPIDRNVIEDNPEIVSNYDEYLYAIRIIVQFLFECIFDIMLIERDTNTKETPKRVAKLFVPDKKTDDELMSGRWCVKPTLTTFENEEEHNIVSSVDHYTNIPLVKICINLYSLCSHHLLPFGTINTNPSVKIVYVVDKIYPGLSKVGRYVNYISRRGWLQENLTRTIADGLFEEFKLKGVLVSLSNIIHTCSVHRGYSDDMEMETLYYNGIFKNDKFLLDRAIKLTK